MCLPVFVFYLSVNNGCIAALLQKYVRESQSCKQHFSRSPDTKQLACSRVRQTMRTLVRTGAKLVVLMLGFALLEFAQAQVCGNSAAFAPTSSDSTDTEVSIATLPLDFGIARFAPGLLNGSLLATTTARV